MRSLGDCRVPNEHQILMLTTEKIVIQFHEAHLTIDLYRKRSLIKNLFCDLPFQAEWEKKSEKKMENCVSKRKKRRERVDWPKTISPIHTIRSFVRSHMQYEQFELVLIFTRNNQ